MDIRKATYNILKEYLIDDRKETPILPDRQFKLNVNSYRKDYGMNTPMNIDIIDEDGRKVIRELEVSHSKFDYMSPIHILIPNEDRMMIKYVKIEHYMSVPIKFRKLDKDGNLIPITSESEHIEIITKVLENLFPVEEYGERAVEELLKESNIKRFWIPAFTHKSSDPNVNKNYEKFEYIGDSVMESSFRYHLLRKFPNFGEGEYTSLSSHYLSKPEQAKLAYKLDLISAVKSDISANIDMAEDVLESLYGVLYLITNSRFINKFTDNIYGDSVEAKYRRQDHKTNVIQYFEKRGMKKPVEYEIVDDDTGNTTILLTIRPEDVDTLHKYLPGIEIVEEDGLLIISESEPHRIKKQSTANAYDIMYDIIEELGSFELDRTSMDQKYINCLDKVYGEYYTDYQVITLRNMKEGVSLAIQAKRKDSNRLDNIVSMTVPITSGKQQDRRGTISTFLNAICRSLR